MPCPGSGSISPHRKTREPQSAETLHWKLLSTRIGLGRESSILLLCESHEMSHYYASLVLLLIQVTGLRAVFGLSVYGGKSLPLSVCILRIFLWTYEKRVLSKLIVFSCASLSFCLWSLVKIPFLSLKDDQDVRDSKCLGPLRPLIFPSRTTHTRFFPKKHGFSYSYLLVGIPVGWRGSIASMISADGKKGDSTALEAWFSVNAGDYLYRGDDMIGLDGKLGMYLKTQVCSFSIKPPFVPDILGRERP